MSVYLVTITAKISSIDNYSYLEFIMFTASRIAVNSLCLWTRLLFFSKHGAHSLSLYTLVSPHDTHNFILSPPYKTGRAVT